MPKPPLLLHLFQEPSQKGCATLRRQQQSTWRKLDSSGLRPQPQQLMRSSSHRMRRDASPFGTDLGNDEATNQLLDLMASHLLCVCPSSLNETRRRVEACIVDKPPLILLTISDARSGLFA